jgi:hypothetical protein
MYQREGKFDFEKLYGYLNDVEQSEKASELGNALIEGGATEEAKFWYEKAQKLFSFL